MSLFSPVRRCCAVCLLLVLCAAGCTQEKMSEGVVATVNGRPITLATLQALQDTRTVSLGTSQRDRKSVV